VIADRVPGRFDEWFFVERDLYDIARRVREYDPDARLAFCPQTGAHGVLVWTRTEDFPQGYWYVGFTAVHPETSDPIAGPPDGRICQMQRRFDVWTHDQRLGRRLRRASEMQEHRRNHMAAENGGRGAEEWVHGYKKRMGQRHHAFISG
jgi:hypothetical protein